jgi:hypothetical protein
VQGMQGMNMGEAALSSMPSFHASSGTAWQLASVPETMWMISPGGWELMFHGVVFAPTTSKVGRAARARRNRQITLCSFGVVTTGFIFNFAKSALFKVEGLAFNGHEPNEELWSTQLAPLDSWSFRVSAAPTRNWTAQNSMGFLQHPEALDPNNGLRAVGLARVQSIVARRKAGERQLGKFVDLGTQAQGTGQHYPEQLSARIDPELSGAELRLHSPRTCG